MTEKKVIDINSKKKKDSEDTEEEDRPILTSMKIEKADNGWFVSGTTEEGVEFSSVFQSDGTDDDASIAALFTISWYMGIELQEH